MGLGGDGGIKRGSLRFYGKARDDDGAYGWGGSEKMWDGRSGGARMEVMSRRLLFTAAIDNIYPFATSFLPPSPLIGPSCTLPSPSLTLITLLI